MAGDYTAGCNVQDLLGRIHSAADQKLRKEGSRERGCIDHIFALKNIIKLCIESNTLYINFINFWKAFDSLHCDTVWKILRAYGIPPERVTLMGLFYCHFECGRKIYS